MDQHRRPHNLHRSQLPHERGRRSPEPQPRHNRPRHGRLHVHAHPSRHQPRRHLPRLKLRLRPPHPRPRSRHQNRLPSPIRLQRRRHDQRSRHRLRWSCGLGVRPSHVHLYACMQGVGPRAAGKSRISSNAGGTAYAESRSDGVDWAFTMNTREFLNGAVGDPLGDSAMAINSAIDGAGL